MEEDRPAWSRRLLLVSRCGTVEESRSCKACCLHWRQPGRGGPPLTDRWRLELRVPSETTSLSGFSPLCSIPQSTPPSSFSLSLLLPFHCTRYHPILQLNLLHTIPHVHELKKNRKKENVADTDTKNYAHTTHIECNDDQLQMFQSKWLIQIFSCLLTVVLPLVIKSQ